MNSKDNGPVLLLGGSGFIGTRLAALLTDQNIGFRIGDIHASHAFPDNWTQCDVRNLDSLTQLAAGVQVIINLAAEHRDDVRPVSRYHECNVQGAEQVCSAAKRAGVRKVIFISSAAVYGFQPKPVHEEGPFEPFNAYGKTKWEAEAVYRKWAGEDRLRSLVIVRPTVVFGEGNRGNVYNLLHQVSSGRFLMVGNGENAKSMAYVGNLAAFLMHSLQFGAGTYIFNYADGPDLTTRQLVEHIRRCLGKEGRLPILPRSIAMTGAHLLDIVAKLTGRSFPISAIRIRKFCESTQFVAQKALDSGFTPPYSLTEGLARTIEAEFKA